MDWDRPLAGHRRERVGRVGRVRPWMPAALLCESTDAGWARYAARRVNTAPVTLMQGRRPGQAISLVSCTVSQTGSR